ncbi:MAG: hypothetical protein GC181_00570 [Bacteroidetes bacterium]|nr:hypothetical protein [Bacteroidota bacterium]
MNFKQFVLLFLVATTIFSCATVGTLTGGDTDTSPPSVISTNPDSAQVNIYPSKIFFNFDELIVVKDFNNEVFLSPPINEALTYKVKNKSFIISLPNSLKPNTTYHLNLGNSISDINEGNVLNNFDLVFSTGNFLDSGNLTGKVYSSINGKPEFSNKLCLYPYKERDSIFNLTLPLYKTQIDSSGFFNFTNIKKNNYFIYGFTDLNKNSRLDVNERVFFKNVDSNTTIANDISSFPFEETEYQFKSISQIKSNKFNIYLNRSLQDSIQLLYGSAQTKNPLISRYNQKENYLEAFIDKNSIPKSDTINLYLTIGTDTLASITTKYIFSNDTTLNKLSVFKPHLTETNKIYVASDNPLLDVKKEYISIVQDSSIVPASNIELINPFLFSVKLPSTITGSVMLIVKDSALNLSSAIPSTDSIEAILYSAEQLGSARIQIKTNQNTERCIFQILSNENLDQQVVYNRIFNSDTSFYFPFIQPGSFTLKVIVDSDKNGYWTNGDIVKLRQPEKIYISPSPLVIRKNWENAFIFDLLE